VRKGLEYFLGVLSSQNFKTRLIMTDGEGAIAKLITELNALGIEVDISGAGGHVARVERRIQVLKERVRTHRHHLPFTPSLLVLLMLILYCVSRLNYEPSSVRGWTASLRELFSGRKADAKRNFRCGFGDYVLCTVPETDNTLKARTEDAVVMLPTGNRTGSVRMLSLHTGKIITRDQFKVLPMPTSVIAILDRMAAADGISLTRTNTGVATDSNTAISYLPTMITPANHTDEDPDIPQLHPAEAGFELQLADEAGIDPSPALHGPGEAGGVPTNPHNFSDHLAGPDTHAASRPTEDENGGEIGGEGEIGGDRQGNGADTGAHDDYTGGERDGIRGDQTGGDDSALEEADEQAYSNSPSGPVARTHAHPIHAPGARLLEHFRRGGTDVALMSREIMGHLGEQAETVMNITVREAIRTRGEDAERVIMKELNQMLTKRVWTPVDGKNSRQGRGVKSYALACS
jgi:hypothetical protein